jgi:hypothetical protein
LLLGDRPWAQYNGMASTGWTPSEQCKHVPAGCPSGGRKVATSDRIGFMICKSFPKTIEFREWPEWEGKQPVCFRAAFAVTGRSFI